MKTTRGCRLVIGALAAVMLSTAGTGCILDSIPPEDAALVGLSWLKDLIIPQSIRLWDYPPDGCYQNGVQVDCATMSN
jgi:hypothetical protein